MRIAILSDIHSNLPAFKLFWDLYGKDVDYTYCLGDLIGYGAFPLECLELMNQIPSTAILGNHENALLYQSNLDLMNAPARFAIEWTRTQLKDKDWKFIKSLPAQAEVKIGLLTHGSPKSTDEYLISSRGLLGAIDFIKSLNLRLCFFGHTHFPGIYDENILFKYDENLEYSLSRDTHYLINPGSLGQPRDGDNRASFCIINTDKYSVKFHRFSYNIDEIANAIQKAGLPKILSDRLYVGR